MIDKEKLKKAQEWADQASEMAKYDPTLPERAKAAAEVIKSLPDEWIDADNLREALQELDSAVTSGHGDQWDSGYNLSTREWAQRLKKLLPAPPTPESASPRPEDVPVGEPWQVEVKGRAAIGYRNDPDARLCWAVVSRDDGTGRHWLYDSDVTLIARLVPEATEQDTEPAFDPEHSYRDRIGNEWSYAIRAWRCFSTATGKLLASHPSPPDKYGPYTRIEDTNE